MMPINHVWAVVLLCSISISAFLLRLYIKDKDKRKLMFSISFLLSNIFFVGAYFNFVGPGVESPSTLLWYNAFVLSSMPLMFAVFIAVNEYFIKTKKFDKLFHLFLIVSFIFILLIFAPFKISFIPTLLRQIIALEVFIVTLYIYYKTKDIRNLYFLFFILVSIVGGVSFNYDTLLTSFSFFIGYIFLALTFIQPKFVKTQRNKGVASYFTLEQKIKTAEKKFKRLFNTIPDAIALLSYDGTILEVNESMAKGFNTSKENIIGKNMHNLLPNDTDNQRTKVAMQALKTNQPQENYDQRNNRYFHNLYVPIKLNNQPNNLLVIARDITEQKKAEKELEIKVKSLKENEKATLNIMEDFQDTIKKLEDAQKQINDLNKNLEKKVEKRTKKIQELLEQKDDFIHQLGHDLKTPLTPINTLLPIVRKKVKDEKLKELLDVSIQNANYMKNLVFKTLQLAKINSPNVQLVLQDTNLSGEFEKIIENKKYELEENKIQIDNNIDENIVVEADKIRLDELIDNLLSNALKYSYDEGGKIVLNAEKKDDEIVVSIDDNGMGMTKEQTKHIFDEFYKIDESRHDLGSTGLGLAICKRIVEKHGGKIWAESPGPKKGTTFYFTIKKNKKNNN